MNIQPVKKHATYQDLCDLPENMVGEIVDGELYSHPRPAPKHAIAANSLGSEITGPFQKRKGGPGGWIFAVEPELHFGFQVLVPDIASWQLENMPEFPDTAYFETPPNWLCEILSPSTSKIDRGPKRRIYAEAGVEFMWILDPDAMILEAFAFRDGSWVLLGTATTGEQVSSEPFDAISFDFDVLFPLEPQSEASVPEQPSDT